MKKILIIVFLAMLLGGVAIAVWLSSSNEAQVFNTNAQIPITQLEGTLVADFPAFPVYPGAILEESSQREKAINSNQDLRAEWKTEDSVKTVMTWYVEALQKEGWIVEPPNDPDAFGEQVAQIKKADFSGYIAVEDEGEEGVEIVVDFKKAQ